MNVRFINFTPYVILGNNVLDINHWDVLGLTIDDAADRWNELYTAQ